MNTLDQLIAAEKEATPAPWEQKGAGTKGGAGPQKYVRIPFGNGESFTTLMHSDENAALVALLRNHAADLLAVARAAQEVMADLKPGLPEHNLNGEHALRAALALLTTEGSDEPDFRLTPGQQKTLKRAWERKLDE